MISHLILLFGLLEVSCVLALPATNALSSENPALQNCYDYDQAVCSGSPNPPDPIPCIVYLSIEGAASSWFCKGGEIFDSISGGCRNANGDSTPASIPSNTTSSTNTTMTRKRQDGNDLASAYEALIRETDGIDVPLAFIQSLLAVTEVDYLSAVWACLFAEAYKAQDLKNILNGMQSSTTNSTTNSTVSRFAH